MTCAACSARVEKAVSAVKGVSSVSVNLLTNSMAVEGTAVQSDIFEAVKKAGYGISAKNGKPQKSEAPSENGEKKLIARLVSSLILLAVLMYFSMGAMMWGWKIPAALEHNHFALGLIQLLLTTAVMVINQRFFISGFRALWHKSPNMDSLVALGSSAAYIYSVYALFAMTFSAEPMKYMHEFYFESAAMILTLITLGKMLEAHSKGRTTDALKGLIALAPKTAVVIRDGAEVTIPAEDVVKGDIFVVKPGESIPADGIVAEGESAVNESALTGESIPADKKVGDKVSAATINLSGYLKCTAVNVGEETALSKIIQMVSDAAATKAPIAKAADKVSGIFVPTVIGIALVTFAVWLLLGQTAGYALARSITVLVISCPCALGLATPVAIMVGSGVGAKNGILFKTAASLEETGKIENIALDKTGTITKGEPRITDVVPLNGTSEDELLRIACTLEKKSEHPLAAAVTALGAERNIPFGETTDFRIHSGNGLEAVLDGKKAAGGKPEFIGQTVPLDSEVKAKYEALAEQGKTPILFAFDGKLIGILAAADVIKEDSRKAVAELKGMGLNVVMLTGDNEKTARAIAAQAGIDNVIAGVLPDEKEAAVRKLCESGRTAMVGDGINDAPALTRADAGIAIGAGTDIAIDAADVVLMKSRLEDVPAAIRLSRSTLRNIRQNLFWAFIYNGIGIPVAAGVFIPLGITLTPMFAAAAMSLSSFCVVTNALRLNLADIYSTKHDKHRHVKHKHKQEEKTMTKTIKIEGMMCSHCEAAVKKALEAIDGVDSAVPSHEKKNAVVTLSKDVADDVLKKAIEDKEYTVLGIE